MYIFIRINLIKAKIFCYINNIHNHILKRNLKIISFKKYNFLYNLNFYGFILQSTNLQKINLIFRN